MRRGNLIEIISGVRWAKAPICGDQLAGLFMDVDAQGVFQRFAGLRIPNASNATRRRIIGDWLRDGY